MTMTADQDTATLVKSLEELLGSDDIAAPRDLLESIHPADQADLYQRLPPEGREGLVALLSAEVLAQIIAHLEEDVREQLVDRMPRAALAAVLDHAANDVAADVLRLLPPSETARVLSNMATAAEAMTFLRLSKPLAEEAYYLYVLDSANRLEGIVNLRQLIVSDPQAVIAVVMARDIVTVSPDADQEEAARLLQHYRLRALPVTDEQGILSGIITADDLIDVIAEEATEDMYRLVGLPADESVFAPLAESTRRRLPWLLINLFAAFAAAGMVAIFEGTIQKAAALAVFMPVVAGQGGNAGIQTITIVVRGIA